MKAPTHIICSIIAGSIMGIGGYVLSLDTKMIEIHEHPYGYDSKQKMVFYHPNPFVTVKLIRRDNDLHPYKKVITQIGPRMIGMTYEANPNLEDKLLFEDVEKKASSNLK